MSPQIDAVLTSGAQVDIYEDCIYLVARDEDFRLSTDDCLDLITFLLTNSTMRERLAALKLKRMST